MKRQPHMWLGSKLCFLKYFLLCSLSSFIIQDVSSAISLDQCEIRASCPQSRECQYTNQMTVDPGSSVPPNCSIMNGGVTRGMTWEQVKQSLNPSDGLVLQQVNSKRGINSCRCTRIKFPRSVQNVFKTSSPNSIYPEKPMKLECRFVGWPLPRVVWYKDSKPINNGSEGFYLSEKLVGKDTFRSILRHPKGQEKHEGIYHCIAKNSIPGWSSELSSVIQMIYECPWPEPPTINSSEVSTTVFSNISLKCLVEIDPDSCLSDLRWYFNKITAPLKTGARYKVEERKTNTKCKRDLILKIVNVTVEDEGKYSCHYYCESISILATATELKVFHQPTDVSSAISLDQCEIRASCPQSRECQYTNQMTVDPGSSVPPNCSIMNGGVTRGMTWEQVKQSLNPSDGLVLQQVNSKRGMNPCRCTRINFARAVQKVWKTSSPEWIYPGESQIELNCSYKGWPVPRVVWYKDGKPIFNGSEGFFLQEKLVGKDTLRSILRHPKSQEKHEGIYNCFANNSIPGWRSETFGIIQMIYECPWPETPTINSSEVSTRVFSNISLKCLVEIDPDCCPSDLRWYFNNNSVPLKTGEKYKVEERKTNTKCKKYFILNIVNVADADEGKYSCYSLCVFGNTSAVIELKVFHQPTGTPVTSNKLFISCSSKHFSWVNASVISFLKKHPVSFSIRSWNSELEKSIVRNVDSGRGSRQLLIVLCDNLLATKFCQEELRMADQRGVDTGDSSLIFVMIKKLKKRLLPGASRNKNLLNYEKHEKTHDWEKKLSHAILEVKTIDA